MTTKLSSVSSVAIYGNCRQNEYVGAIRDFVELMLLRGIHVVSHPDFLQWLRSEDPGFPEISPIENPAGKVDAVVSIGGDGTFLHAARWVEASAIPILGLNTGHLGFLANCSISDASGLVDALLSGNSFLEPRTVLQIRCDSLPEGIHPFALNEVALMKEETSSMITVNVCVDGIFLADYLADGLIVSTPTGSTAYNLSAGGPLLHPRLDCIVLSPVAPHSLTLRPMVVGGDSEICAVVSSRATDFRVSVDGCSFIVPCGECIEIRRAPFDILTIRRPGDDFASTLRNKLLWGRR